MSRDLRGDTQPAVYEIQPATGYAGLPWIVRAAIWCVCLSLIVSTLFGLLAFVGVLSTALILIP